MEDLDLIVKSPSSVQRIQAESAQFRVAAIGENKCKLTSYNRRDFYKITLVLKGNSQLLYAIVVLK